MLPCECPKNASLSRIEHDRRARRRRRRGDARPPATRSACRMSTAPCRKLSRAARGLSGLKTRSSGFFVEPPLRAPCSTASKPKPAAGRRRRRQLRGDAVGDERAHRAARAVVVDDQRPAGRRQRPPPLGIVSAKQTVLGAHQRRACRRSPTMPPPVGGRLVGRRARLVDRHRELAVDLVERRRRAAGQARAGVPSSHGEVTPGPHSVSDGQRGRRLRRDAGGEALHVPGRVLHGEHRGRRERGRVGALARQPVAQRLVGVPGVAERGVRRAASRPAPR